MRIIIANDTYYPNVDGCSYFSQRLAHHLKERGHDILVIAPSSTIHTKYFSHDRINILGIRSIPTFLHKDYRFTPPYFIKKPIKEAIVKFAPDIIHIQGHFYIERAVADAGRELSIPVMGTNHFMPDNLIHYAHAPKFVECIAAKLMWHGFKKVFEKLTIITTPTYTAVKLLKTIGLKKETIPISCGIDLKKFNPQNDGAYLKKKYKLPETPILLSVGRLAPEKNIDFVLCALSQIHKKTPIHFVVAGDGMERSKLEKLARDLHIERQVTFTGFIRNQDLQNLYAISDAFVIAGTIELQSLVTMEALASGLPVIAANALALPELVNSGQNGYLFELDDVKKIAHYIQRIFEDKQLRNSMSEKSLEIAKSHAIEKTIDRFERLYESLRIK